MPSKKPYITIRTSEENKAKLAYIAEQDGRSESNYGEMLIKKAISEYEAKHGPIPLQEDILEIKTLKVAKL